MVLEALWGKLNKSSHHRPIDLERFPFNTRLKPRSEARRTNSGGVAGICEDCDHSRDSDKSKSFEMMFVYLCQIRGGPAWPKSDLNIGV